jgi:hypothetical protein
MISFSKPLKSYLINEYRWIMGNHKSDKLFRQIDHIWDELEPEERKFLLERGCLQSDMTWKDGNGFQWNQVIKQK